MPAMIRVALTLALAVVSGMAGMHAPAGPAPTKPTATADATTTTTSTVHPSKVLVVLEENHSYAQMRAGMPYLFSLSKKYGYATNWTAITHPSLPNYLAVSGGSTFGITDDRAPAAHRAQVGNARSVFDQAIDAGKTARTYAESMPSRCYAFGYPSNAPSYAVRHNPWTYYSASRSRCKVNDVPLTGFGAAAKSNTLPNVGFVIPNLCDDAHNCSLATADAFLKKTLPDVLDSEDFTTGRLAVVVTADEDDKKSGNTVLTSVLSTRLSGRVVTTHLTHYSLTRYLAQVLGVVPLRNGMTAPDMKAAFGL
jgi:hypothetical protein